MAGFDYVRERCCGEINRSLATLATLLESEGSNNLMSSHVYLEDSVAALLNCAFDYELTNANIFEHNASCFDLRDDNNKVIIQVSTDQSRGKITHTLTNNRLLDFPGYAIRFFFACSSSHAYKKPYPAAPNGVLFDLERDVFNIPTFIGMVRSMEISKIRELNKVCREEFGWKPDQGQLVHGLSAVVRALGEHELVPVTMDPATVFAIDEKIQLNEMDLAAEAIRDCAAYTHELITIYDEYARAGNNRMRAIFQRLKRRYREALRDAGSKDEAFFLMVDRIRKELSSELYDDGIAEEELELYVMIVVSDAFMRCIVFDGPSAIALPPSGEGLGAGELATLFGGARHASH